jgi:hypothetical protein
MPIAALRSAGLHPLALDTASHFSFAGADISYHIELPTSEVGVGVNNLRLCISYDE